MPNFCHVTILGHLTRDPEIRYLKNETSVANFGICYNRGYGDNKKAVFVECSAWNKTAEYITKYHAKGDAIFISGSIDVDEWTDKETGDKRSRLKIAVNEIQGVSKREGGGNRQPQERRNAQQSMPEDRGSDDIYGDDPPF